MPILSRRIGADYERDGAMVTPRVLLATCEVCGGYAVYLDLSSRPARAWCAMINGEFACGQTGGRND